MPALVPDPSEDAAGGRWRIFDAPWWSQGGQTCCVTKKLNSNRGSLDLSVNWQRRSSDLQILDLFPVVLFYALLRVPNPPSYSFPGAIRSTCEIRRSLCPRRSSLPFILLLEIISSPGSASGHEKTTARSRFVKRGRAECTMQDNIICLASVRFETWFPRAVSCKTPLSVHGDRHGK